MAWKTVKLAEINDNPYRTAGAYAYIDGKVKSLMANIIDSTYWENILVQQGKDGKLYAAYGHHRLEALRRLVADGNKDYEEIKVNVRSYTKLTPSLMLKILVQENSNDWQDSASNSAMSLFQVKLHLENILRKSKDVGEFLKHLGKNTPLKMNAQAFGRAKNKGVGSSLISQYLSGVHSETFVRETLKLIEADKDVRKRAQTLGTVTNAARFVELVTKVDEKGKKVKGSVEDDKEQEKTLKIVDKAEFNRQDMEEAIKLQKTNPAMTPSEAAKAVAKVKTDTLKAEREALAAARAPAKAKIEVVEERFLSLQKYIQSNEAELKTQEVEFERLKAALTTLTAFINAAYVAPPEEEEAKATEGTEGAEAVGGAPEDVSGFLD